MSGKKEGHRRGKDEKKERIKSATYCSIKKRRRFGCPSNEEEIGAGTFKTWGNGVPQGYAPVMLGNCTGTLFKRH